MPQGRGTYGRTRGRPPAKKTAPAKKKPVGIAKPSKAIMARMQESREAAAKRAQKAAAGGSGMAAGIAKARRTQAAKKQAAKRKPRKNIPSTGGPISRPRRRS